MRVFKNAWFARFARKHRIPDKALLDAIADAERGQIDANLGGGVLKQRVARQGEGKSGGFRTIILYRMEERAFFVYGFAKSERSNISKDEEAQFKKAASHVLNLTEKQLSELIHIGQFSEVDEDD